MLSSREINPNLNVNNKNKIQYSEKDLVKFLKLHKMISGSSNLELQPQTQPQPQPQQCSTPYIQQPMMYPQQMTHMPMPMSMSMPMGSQSELSNSEREDIRRMIYKSNEELEGNLKDFISILWFNINIIKFINKYK